MNIFLIFGSVIKLIANKINTFLDSGKLRRNKFFGQEDD